MPFEYETPAYAQKAVLRQYFHIEPSHELVDKWIYLKSNDKLVSALITKWGDKDQKAKRFAFVNKAKTEKAAKKQAQNAARNAPEHKVDVMTRQVIALRKELESAESKLHDPKYAVMRSITERDIAYYQNQVAMKEAALAKLVLR